jgi:hypothetical protein
LNSCRGIHDGRLAQDDPCGVGDDTSTLNVRNGQSNLERLV